MGIYAYFDTIYPTKNILIFSGVIPNYWDLDPLWTERPNCTIKLRCPNVRNWANAMILKASIPCSNTNNISLNKLYTVAYKWGRIEARSKMLWFYNCLIPRFLFIFGYIKYHVCMMFIIFIWSKYIWYNRNIIL